MLLDNAITGCLEDPVDEIRTLGRTLSRWREEILNHHRTGASNGPTEGMNFCAKQVKRAGRGFTKFSHYRLRVLLYAGGVHWPKPIRTADHLNASTLKPEEPSSSRRMGTSGAGKPDNGGHAAGSKEFCSTHRPASIGEREITRCDSADRVGSQDPASKRRDGTAEQFGSLGSVVAHLAIGPQSPNGSILVAEPNCTIGTDSNPIWI